jgi:hypothetical protein
MSTTVTIGGTPVACPNAIVPDKLNVYVKGGVESFSFYTRGGALPATDPYLGQSIVVAIGGTTYFTGRVVSVNPEYRGIGWVRSYQSIGLRGLGDFIPLTDPTLLTDSSTFNLVPEDPNYQAGRAGRTVGQILTTVLTALDNATNLNAYGIGAYTTLSPPTLPSSTTTDLAALTLVPPTSIDVQGEKLLSAIEAFLSQWAPNHCLRIDPATGAVRVLDQRSFTSHTLTMDSDPIQPAPLSRDVSGCYQKVTVRGQPIATMALFKTSQSTITEDFAYTGHTNAQAKADWLPSQFANNGQYQDTGTITMGSTTTLTYTSSDGATFTSDQLDQNTGSHATVNLWNSGGSGLTQFWTARVVANGATSGGTTAITIDVAAPSTSFDKCTISYNASGAANVWRLYKIADSTLWPLVVNQSTYPQPFIMPGSFASSAVLTSTPIGVVFGPDGRAFPAPFQYLGSSTGTLLFAAPTWTTAGNAAPTDVWVLLPINTASNTTSTAGYSGTSNSVEGLTDTLTVTVPEWRDPAQGSQMASYASDVLDSVKDGVVEGTVTYHGLYTTALTMGQALKIAGSGYTSGYGWSANAIPIVECELEWTGATLHTTRMKLSNRRAHYSAGAFLHPARTGLTWGPAEGLLMAGLSGFGGAAFGGVAGGFAQASRGGSGVESLPQTPADLGIASTPGEFLMNAGADPFGGLNPGWNAEQARRFAPPEPAEGGEKEGGE